jgi:hypothetical protein
MRGLPVPASVSFLSCGKGFVNATLGRLRSLYDAPVSGEPHIRRVPAVLTMASRLFGRPELHLPSRPILC